MHTGRMPCEDEGRNWGDAPTSQGMPKTASKPPEVRQKPDWETPRLTQLNKLNRIVFSQ